MVSTTVKRSLGDVPRWNLSTVFPSLDSAELKNAIAKSQADITALETFLDQHHISKTGSTTRTADQFANIINGYLGQANALLRLFYTVGTYISLTVSADSFDTTARRMMSEIEPLSVRLSQIDTRFTGRLVAETIVGGRPAVVPEITGRAWITGTGQYGLDPEDPFPAGFAL